MAAHRPKLRLLLIASQIILAAAVANGHPASAAEVTSVGSPWPDREAPMFNEQFVTDAPENMPKPGVPFPPPVIASDDANSDDTQFGLSGPPVVIEAPQWFVRPCRPLEADWYVKFDYFTWRETDSGGTELLNEHGTLYTLGYERAVKARRLRLELFTGDMEYAGNTWGGAPLRSTTRYLGGRAEFELLWDVCPQRWPEFDCYLGLGTRFWIRDLKDGDIVGTDLWSIGYQETWVTLYPYIGLEKRWGQRCDEFFVNGRLGATAYTYQSADHLLGDPDNPQNQHRGGPLNPSPGLIAKIELGLRHEQFFVSALFEAMSWEQSPVNKDHVMQPTSWMTTTGLRLGLVY